MVCLDRQQENLICVSVWGLGGQPEHICITDFKTSDEVGDRMSCLISGVGVKAAVT